MPYNSVRREYLRRLKEQKGTGKQEIEEWQKRWRDAGPIEFAEHLLICPSDVPSHPDFNLDNNPNLPCNDDCPLGKEHPKFRENGTPYHLILSDDEKEFLIDVWKNGITMAIIAAARGTGKTFTLAIYNCWRITCFDRWSITCIGGSSEQSENIQDYIDDWRLDIPIIRRIIYKSLRGIKPRVKTRGRSSCRFPACSTQAARGKHVNTVEIDEACVPPDTKIVAWCDDDIWTKGFNPYPKFVPIREANYIVNEDGDLDVVNYHTRNLDYSGYLVKIIPYFNNIGVQVTPNHRIKVIQRDPNKKYVWNNRIFPEPIDDVIKREAIWIPAKDLWKNDVLVSPIPKRHVVNMRISEERLKLIGYYISEGSVGDHQIYFSNKSEDIINEITLCIHKEFGKKPSITKVNRCTNVYFTNREFRSWLLKNCGHLAENKHIPHELMCLPDEQLNIILNAIMAGDGERGIKKDVLHVKSEELVQQFWFIYASRSILTTIEKDKYGYCVWRHWKKQKSIRSYGKIRNGKFYVPIREIIYSSYKGAVYNLECFSHSYIVPYITLHNCEAESKSENGSKAVAAVQWQTTGKRSGELFLSSTVQFIYGTFYDYMKNPEKYGFQKVYRWAMAKHISGEIDPTKVYTDKDPTHWLPNVWWITKSELMNKRLSKSNEEWLCEALGGASMASGAVFKKEDLDICICRLCEECEPYVWRKCKLCEMGKLGTPEDPTKYIIERQAGFDYGYSNAPCSLTISGRKGDVLFVLFNDEQIGMRDTEKPDWIDKICQQYKTHTFIPDPNASGKHLNEPLEEKGYAIYIIAEKDKTERVSKTISFVEKHKIIIPKAFWYLTASLRKLAWDKKGKIRKIDDHSFDSLCYSMEGFEVEEIGENIFEEFLRFQRETPTPLKEDDFFKGIKW